MMEEFNKSDFLERVKNHQLEIFYDEGINRHIRFSEEGRYAFSFELITWEDHLCICGDMGTYVFRRLTDMFDFFRDGVRGDDIGINPGYWGEKLRSICRSSKYKEYSPESFEEAVKYDFEIISENWNEKDKSECWQDIEIEILSFSEYESEAYSKAMEFEFKDSRIFGEFWENNCKEFTWHYLWCLYAIVWGIREYDKFKKSQEREFQELMKKEREIHLPDLLLNEEKHLQYLVSGQQQRDLYRKLSKNVDKLTDPQRAQVLSRIVFAAMKALKGDIEIKRDFSSEDFNSIRHPDTETYFHVLDDDWQIDASCQFDFSFENQET